jgi:hypothetical protein
MLASVVLERYSEVDGTVVIRILGKCRQRDRGVEPSFFTVTV